ncbi:MAG: hypothetical protein ABSG68_26830 [Thermoguttaceae bacterium]|jgi:hypothetical protein
MKCRFLIDMERPFETPEEEAAFRATGRFPIRPAGSELENPEAYLLVRMGCAEPADPECEAAHGMGPEQLAAARTAYVRVAAGIHPDDYAAFDAGEMVGYDADGRPIPGPNYCGSLADYEAGAMEEEDTLD